jgi:DNA-binding transcriptional LysR family regulator
LAAKRAPKHSEDGKRLVPPVHGSNFNDADARLFVAVAEQGSFAAAAASLRLTPSAVSKALARLEGALGVKLVARTTRALHLTEEGFAFRERCVRAFDLLAEAAEEASSSARAMRGTIRIGLPSLFGTHFLPRALPAFVTAHPDIRVELVSTMRLTDVVDLGLDLAIIVGELPDSSLLARPLGYGEFVVVASPAYLAHAGTPHAPEDLAEHRCLAYARPDGRDAPWMFRDGDSTRFVGVTGKLRSDDMHHLAAMATVGLGVAQLPLFAVARAIDDGSLRRILRVHEPPPKLASLVFPAKSAMPRRVRALVEALATEQAAMVGVMSASKARHARAATKR